MEKLNVELFEKNIYDDGEPCCVLFTRKACHVCQSIKPKLEELEADFRGRFGFYTVDVDEEKGLFQRFLLKGVPQVLFFNGGDYVGKMAGEKDIEDYEEKIEDILG